MINIALRFDDPSSKSNHDLERKLVDCLAKCGACATFAVIPYVEKQPLRGHAVSHLVAAQDFDIIEIAQHGLTHESLIADRNLPSEFQGAHPKEQLRRVIAGKGILEAVFGRPIYGFIPPFNTFDQNTIDALEDTGFRYISAGIEHGLPITRALAQVPRTCQARELRAAVAEAQRRTNTASTIIAVIHHYDFEEHGPSKSKLTWSEFERLILWLKQQRNVRVVTLRDLANLYDARTWHSAVRRGRFVQRLHWRLRNFLPKHCLMTKPLVEYIRFPERHHND